jgi:hypothetical protein
MFLPGRSTHHQNREATSENALPLHFDAHPTIDGGFVPT